jgi:hypothetical protein
LSPEEDKTLRQLLAKARNEGPPPIQEFDLNKPHSEPYSYQEFPYTLYDHRSKRTRLAANAQERQRLIAMGWRSEPFPAAFQEVELPAEEREEAEVLNQVARMTPEQVQAAEEVFDQENAQFEAVQVAPRKKGKA